MSTIVREPLPARRPHEVFDFVFSRGLHDPVGCTYTTGIGRSADGAVAEIFLDCHKLSSAMTDDARDAAVTLSIALQHGVPLAAFGPALSRHEDGRPCGLVGRLLDVLRERGIAS